MTYVLDAVVSLFRRFPLRRNHTACEEETGAGNAALKRFGVVASRGSPTSLRGGPLSLVSWSVSMLGSCVEKWSVARKRRMRSMLAGEFCKSCV
jgi:hypothetical protein